MTNHTHAALQSAERTEEQLRETRVTAAIIRGESGDSRTVYRAHGREFTSLTALKAALEVGA